MKAPIVLALVVSSLLLGSCGESEEPAGDPTRHNWQLETGAIDGESIPVLADHPITLSFDEDAAGGTAACNGYGGGYDLTGSTIRFDPPAVTEMACSPSVVMESESAYLTALVGVSAFSMGESRLTLTGDGVELVFALVPPVPEADLTGTVWLLEAIIDGDTVSSVTGEPATLELFSDGSVIGSTGCRTFTGSYALDGAEVEVTELRMGGDCAAELARQDDDVVAVLGDGFGVDIDGATMTVTGPGGKGLVYEADESPG